MAKVETEYERTLKQRAELKEIGDKLLALEAELGLTEEMERARGHNFFPLGIDGEDVSPDEYFADEHDGRRDRTREAYFAVPDVEKRKQLIKLDRDYAKKAAQHSEDDFRRAEWAVAQARKAVDEQPWGWAAGVAVVCVAFGFHVFQLVGAIAGAVGGFFLAQGTIASKKKNSVAAVAQAEETQKDLQKHRFINSLTPDLFAHIESLTGEEDKQFGHESARRNVSEYEAKLKSQPPAR